MVFKFYLEMETWGFRIKFTKFSQPLQHMRQHLIQYDVYIYFKCWDCYHFKSVNMLCVSLFLLLFSVWSLPNATTMGLLFANFLISINFGHSHLDAKQECWWMGRRTEWYSCLSLSLSNKEYDDRSIHLFRPHIWCIITNSLVYSITNIRT